MVDLAAGWLCLRVSLIWLRVRPAGLAVRAVWICSASGSPVAPSRRPAGGSGGVVVECERGVEVLGADLLFAVGEGVEQREPDRVCFGAGSDLAEHAGEGSGELAVGVVPELAGVWVEADFAGGLGVLEGRGEQLGEAGGVQRVVVAAFG